MLTGMIRYRRFVGLLAAVACVVLLVFGLTAYRAAATLRDHGIEATAVVNEIALATKGRTTVDLEYQDADGDDVFVTVRRDRFASTEPVVGRKIPIRYSPADPTSFVEAGAEPSFQAAWNRFGLAAIAAIVAGLALLTRRRPGVVRL